MGHNLPTDTNELRATDVSGWSSRDGSMKDTCDQKEMMLLSRLLSELAHNRLPQLADVITQRIRELHAKTEESSWDKAGVLSLQPGSYAASAPVPDGAFTL